MRTNIAMLKEEEEQAQKDKFRRLQARLANELMHVERMEREQSKVRLVVGQGS